MTPEDFERNFADMQDGLRDALEKGVIAATEHVAGEVREVVYDTFDVRTGALARSFKESLLREGEEIKGRVLSDLVYAGIQDTGGTIYPRRGRYLAVPLGTQRMNVRWPRDWPKGRLVLIKSKKGNKLLVEIIGKKIQPRYLLKANVTLTGKRYLDTAMDRAQPGVTEILGDHVALHIDRGIAGG